MIEKIIVVGSGVMGRGIAYISALAGFQTSLLMSLMKQLK